MFCFFSGPSCHCRQPGLAGQKQVSVFSDVETAGGVGEADLPMGESSAPNVITPCTGTLLSSARVYRGYDDQRKYKNLMLMRLTF